MSGFVAVLNLDGAAVVGAELHHLTNALSFRGPDGQNVWINDKVGLGHTLLRTTDDVVDRQPCNLEGITWITGDIRVDGRETLRQKLAASGQVPPKSASDAELVLYSYKAWGDAFLDNLLGDFSFAIWDGENRRLFCARDQLGVKPLYYAQAGSQLVVSNTLVCLRAHPAVPDDLNAAAVGDFLLFGFNCDPGTTTFEAICRLPAGHTLTCKPGTEPRVERYWALPFYEERRLPRRRDYIELCQDILREAISDRLRTDRVGIHMSGGLDSTLIAATARALLADRYAGFDLRAYTVVYDKLFHDEERYFSRIVADSLPVPIHYLQSDDFKLFAESNGDPCGLPEPLDVLARPTFFSALSRLTRSTSRVVLSGFDGDALLTASWFKQLARRASDGEVRGLVADAFEYAWAKQNPIGALLHRMPWSRRVPFVEPAFPKWLRPGFAQEIGLKDRWASASGKRDLGDEAREGAYTAMTLPTWAPILESRDPGVTGVPVEHRHPLLDLRMIEFALSLPAIPWCVDKYIFREAARHMLPRPIRTRPKSPLGGDPMPHVIRRYFAESKQAFALHPEMEQFINPSCVSQIIDETRSGGYWYALRVLILNFWLSSNKGACK